jgi:hypothetical protein
MFTIIWSPRDLTWWTVPPYSPDLAPSNFFLFPLVKKRLDQFECDDPNDLLEAITEILGSPQADELHRVFQDGSTESESELRG